MSDGSEFETELDAYHQQVDRPLIRLSAAIVGVALGGGALFQWVRGVAMNFFAHGVMYAIRTEDYENERVRGVSRDVFDAQMDVLKLSYFYRPGMQLITGELTTGEFVDRVSDGVAGYET